MTWTETLWCPDCSQWTAHSQRQQYYFFVKKNVQTIIYTCEQCGREVEQSQ